MHRAVKLVALFLLRADIDQRHPRLLYILHRLHIGRAHGRELNQVIRLAVGVGPAVD